MDNKLIWRVLNPLNGYQLAIQPCRQSRQSCLQLVVRAGFPAIFSRSVSWASMSVTAYGPLAFAELCPVWTYGASKQALPSKDWLLGFDIDHFPGFCFFIIVSVDHSFYIWFCVWVLHVYIYIYINTYIYIYTHTFNYLLTYLCSLIYLYIYIHVYIYILLSHPRQSGSI